MPFFTTMSLIVPSAGAETVVSIFMASMMMSLSPALTSVPGETANFGTIPRDSRPFFKCSEAHPAVNQAPGNRFPASPTIHGRNQPYPTSITSSSKTNSSSP